MRQAYITLGRILYWVVWPGSWLYLRGSERTRILLRCGDEILVVRNWLSNGAWKVPGGGLKAGEDPAIGASRELEEETGVRLNPQSLRHLSEEMYRLHGLSYTSHYFVADIPDQPPIRVNAHEIVGYAWLRHSDISPETCAPDVLRALELERSTTTLDRH